MAQMSLKGVLLGVFLGLMLACWPLRTARARKPLLPVPASLRIASVSGMTLDGDCLQLLYPNGREPQELLSLPPEYDLRELELAPNHTRLAFILGTPTSAHICLMNADGSGQTLIDSAPCTNIRPTWAPDGSHIAFISNRDENYEIYRVNTDGSALKRLTRNRFRDSHPDWSPDGSRIVFSRYQGRNAEIYVMRADGSGEEQLTRSPGTDSLPAWSPDGSRIAFVSHRDGQCALYRMNADGSAQTRLAAHLALDTLPSWSPDGRRIACYGGRNRKGGWNLTLVNADGTGVRRIPLDAMPDPRRPIWSPDGRFLVFSARCGRNYDLYIASADSGKAWRLRRPAIDSYPIWVAAPDDPAGSRPE